MISAIAETAALVVLHDDKDFELIGEVTGQEMQRLAADAPGGREQFGGVITERGGVDARVVQARRRRSG